MVLYAEGPLSESDLARLMGWGHERAHRAVRVLAADGQVTERGGRYELTEKGRKELDGVTEWMEVQDE